MRQIPSAPEIAIVSGDFGGFAPEELYDYFTSAELLCQWWPKEAEVEPRVGGRFRLSWPEQDWRLRGEYLAREPGRRLSFTWYWDHEPSAESPKTVEVWFMPIEDRSCRVAIFHGPFENTASDQGARQGIVEGWIHYGMILAGKRTGSAD